MTRAAFALIVLSILASACETIPLGAPADYAAAEHGLPPAPPSPPDPGDGACWVEGPNCTGLCTPCPEK